MSETVVYSDAPQDPSMPGVGWRVLAHTFPGPDSVSTARHQWDGPGVFDELVVPGVVHVEQMDVDSWWLSIGPVLVDVTVGVDGRACSVLWRVEDVEGWAPDESVRGWGCRWVRRGVEPWAGDDE